MNASSTGHADRALNASSTGYARSTSNTGSTRYADRALNAGSTGHAGNAVDARCTGHTDHTSSARDTGRARHADYTADTGRTGDTDNTGSAGYADNTSSTGHADNTVDAGSTGNAYDTGRTGDPDGTGRTGNAYDTSSTRDTDTGSARDASRTSNASRASNPGHAGNTRDARLRVGHLHHRYDDRRDGGGGSHRGGVIQTDGRVIGRPENLNVVVGDYGEHIVPRGDNVRGVVGYVNDRGAVGNWSSVLREPNLYRLVRAAAAVVVKLSRELEIVSAVLAKGNPTARRDRNAKSLHRSGVQGHRVTSIDRRSGLARQALKYAVVGQLTASARRALNTSCTLRTGSAAYTNRAG